jgi:hypothetical protein
MLTANHLLTRQITTGHCEKRSAVRSILAEGFDLMGIRRSAMLLDLSDQSNWASDLLLNQAYQS